MKQAQHLEELYRRFESDLKFQILAESSEECQGLLTNETVRHLCSQMTYLWFFKVLNSREQFEIFCVGHPILTQSYTVDSEIMILKVNSSNFGRNTIRQWFEAFEAETKGTQQLISQLTTDEMEVISLERDYYKARIQFNICFADSAAQYLPASISERRAIVDAISDRLSVGADIAIDLCRPLSEAAPSFWLLWFGKYMVFYELADTQVKVLLIVEKKPEVITLPEGVIVQPEYQAVFTVTNFSEDDFARLELNEELTEFLLERSQKSDSKSLETVEHQLFQDEVEEKQAAETEKQWAQARLELLAECGTQQCAEQFSRHFDGVIFTLSDEGQYQCRAEMLQDVEQNYWCRICPIGISIVPKTVYQTTMLQSLLYDNLRSAPAFRYALVSVGAYQYLINSESPQTYSQVLKGDIHPVAYTEGMVLSETIWREMESPPKSFEPFNQGYVWMSTRAKLIDSRHFEPVLNPDPQSAEEYYGNGSILGHQGQHQESLTAFEMALRLNPTFDQAYSGKDAALYNLGRSRQEALEFYEALIRSMPDYAFAYLQKGICLDELGRDTEALHLVETSLRLAPNSVQAHHSKGIILDRLNQSEAALSALEESLRLDPNYKPAQASKRIVLRRLNALRESNQKTSELEVLKTRLLQLVYGDRDACNRLVEAEFERSPHKSETQWYRDAIKRLERDRER